MAPAPCRATRGLVAVLGAAAAAAALPLQGGAGGVPEAPPEVVPTLQLGFCNGLRRPQQYRETLAVALAVKLLVKEQGSHPDLDHGWGNATFDVQLHFRHGQTATAEVADCMDLAVAGDRRPVHAIIGCSFSSSSEVLATIAAHNRVVQVSYRSAAISLSDKLRYPFFFRMTAPTISLAKVFVALCHHFRWSRVGMLYEDDSYGMSAYDAVHATVATSQLWPRLTVWGHQVYAFRQEELILTDNYIHAARSAYAERSRVWSIAFAAAFTQLVFFKVVVGTGLNKRLIINLSGQLQHWDPVDREPCIGMLNIELQEFVDSEVSHAVEAAWAKMTWEELPGLGVPADTVARWKQSQPDMFTTSLLQNGGAYAFDTAAVILRAFQRVLDSGKEVVTGTDLQDSMYKTRLFGVTGPVSFTYPREGMGGDLESTVFVVQELEGDGFQELGHVIANTHMVEKTLQLLPPSFPDGNGDPRNYEALPVLTMGVCTTNLHSVVAAAFAIHTLKKRLKNQFLVHTRFGFARTAMEEAGEGLRLVMGMDQQGGTNWHVPVDVLVGCTYSSTSQLVAQAAAFTNVVQVSHQSEADILSDKLRFPYFLRTIAPTSASAKAWVALIALFGWRRIGVLYAEDVFGQDTLEALTRAAGDGSPNQLTIRTYKLYAFDTNSSAIREQDYLAAAKKAYTEVRVLCGVFSSLVNFAIFLQVAGPTRLHERLLIASWILELFAHMSANLRKRWLGMIGTQPSPYVDNAVSRWWADRWHNFSFSRLDRLKLPRYVVDAVQLEMPDLFRTSSPFDFSGAYIFDAVSAIIQAYASALTEGNLEHTIRGKVLRDSLYNTTFTGATGKVEFTPWDDTFASAGGNPVYSRYTVFNLVGGADGTSIRLQKLGEIEGKVVMLDFQPVFPDGSSNPRHFDYSHLDVDGAALGLAIVFVSVMSLTVLSFGTPNPISDVSSEQAEGRGPGNEPLYSVRIRLKRPTLVWSLPLCDFGRGRFDFYTVQVRGTGAGADLDGQLFRLRFEAARRAELLRLDGTLVTVTFPVAASQGSISLVHWHMLTAVTGALYTSAMVALVIALKARFLQFALESAAFGLLAVAAWPMFGYKVWAWLQLTSLDHAHAQYRRTIVPLTYTGGDRDLSHPKYQGVAAGTLIDVYKHYREFLGADRSMHYVVPNIIRPLTKPKQCSFATLWGGQPAVHFVSHCWSNPFHNFVEAIHKHAMAIAGDDWRQDAYWVCCFSVNQWCINSELGATVMDSAFAKVLNGGLLRDTVMVLDKDLVPLSRVWCLFEVWMSKQSGIDFKFACRSGIIRASMDGSKSDANIVLAIAERLPGIQVAESKASNAQDKEDILNMIEESLGSLEEMDRHVKALMHLAIESVATNMADALMKPVGTTRFSATKPSHPSRSRPRPGGCESSAAGLGRSGTARWSRWAGENPLAPVPRRDSEDAEGAAGPATSHRRWFAARAALWLPRVRSGLRRDAAAAHSAGDVELPVREVAAPSARLGPSTGLPMLSASAGGLPPPPRGVNRA